MLQSIALRGPVLIVSLDEPQARRRSMNELEKPELPDYIFCEPKYAIGARGLAWQLGLDERKVVRTGKDCGRILEGAKGLKLTWFGPFPQSRDYDRLLQDAAIRECEWITPEQLSTGHS